MTFGGIQVTLRQNFEEFFFMFSFLQLKKCMIWFSKKKCYNVIRKQKILSQIYGGKVHKFMKIFIRNVWKSLAQMSEKMLIKVPINFI